MTRYEVFELWRKDGLISAKQQEVHILRSIAIMGTVCFGPMKGQEQQVVLMDTWIPEHRDLGRAEALGEWVLRYFRSHGPATPERLKAHRKEAMSLRLLPGFDELVLGYRDRSPSLPSSFDKAICPGGNGMFRATVVKGGQVVGTWRPAGTGTKRRADPEPFEDDFSPADDEAIARCFAGLPSS